MSSNVVKGSFIRFSGENTRVIDSQDLVKKRMDDFSGVLRERGNIPPENPVNEYDDSLLSEEELRELTGDVSDDGFKEISFGQTAERISTDNESTNNNMKPEPVEEEVRLNPEAVRAECEEMISKANSRADEIRTMARTEAQQIKEEARNSGYAEGLEAGRAEGLEEYNEKIRELEAEKEAMYAQYNALLDELEPKMVEVVSTIYEHIFGNSLYDRRDVLTCLLNRALSSVNSDGNVSIFVSPEDHPSLVDRVDSIIAGTALKEMPDIRIREDLEAGQAKIETAYGILDCSIDTEFEELKKALIMLSYERRD